MGRWSQSRRGKGGGTPRDLIRIATAHLVGSTEADVIYTANVNAADFAPSQFETLPSGNPGVTVTQQSPNTLRVDFTLSTAGDDTIQWTGNTLNVLTPQSVLYT